jgi:hypothetical protein
MYGVLILLLRGRLTLVLAHLPARYFHISFGGHVGDHPSDIFVFTACRILMSGSYIATELLGTDLGRLLSVKPLDSKFAQYFIYQILVWISEPG